MGIPAQPVSVTADTLSPRYTIGGEIDVNSRYIWRGIDYSNGPVVQPYLWATWNTTTLTAWSSMPVSSEPGRGTFDQLFVSVSHEMAIGPWQFEPALQGYSWRGMMDETTTRTLELAGRLSRPLGPLLLTMSHAFDVTSYAGSWIADAGIAWERTTPRWQLEASLSTAWANGKFNRVYVGAPAPAVNNVQFTVAGTRYGRRGWYVQPHAEFVGITAPSVRRALEARTLMNAGISVGWTFPNDRR